MGPGRPRIRTTFQFKGRIAPLSGFSLGKTWEAVVDTCLHWFSGKYVFTLPAEARERQSFFSEEPGQSLRCLALDSPRLWAARLEQPDSPYRGRAAIPGRTWTTDVSVALDTGDVVIGIRVQCASLPFGADSIKLTRPRLVLDLARNFQFPGQRRISGKPWILRESELSAFKSYLESPRRTGPVYLLTEPDEKKLGLRVKPFLLDAEKLATRVQGLATVVCLDRRTGFQWTNLVGRDWSAYLGSVRTYRPGLRFLEDSRGMHPLARAERVLAFNFEEQTSESAFEAFLEQDAFEQSAHHQVDWPPCLFLPQARLLSAEIARREAGENSDFRKMYEEEISLLNDRLREAESESESYNDDALRERKIRQQIEDENKKLRIHLDALRTALEQKSGSSVDAIVEIPAGLEELPDWTESNLVGRLVLHSRAVRGLKNATFEKPRLVYEALQLLAREYRDMRLGMDASKERFDSRCAELGLTHSPSIAQSKATKEGDQYFVNFPPGSAQSRFLESHLKKGVSQDPRHALRIYFFWDADSNQVVVGWLPSHLDNSLTN